MSYVSTFTRLMIWWSHTRHVQQGKASKQLDVVYVLVWCEWV